MYKYAIRNLARTLAPTRVPDPDPSALSPRYCYSVWLRHLVMAADCGLRTDPAAVAELGPGATQGTGIAALLSGAATYVSADVVDYGVEQQNEAVFEQLVGLFRDRVDIPGPDEFPKMLPALASYEFPHGILTEERLRRCLDEPRLCAIRNALREPGVRRDGIRIQHCLIAERGIELDEGSFDMIFSQGVLLYCPELESMYRSMAKWLKPGAFVSHQIDFSCSPSFPETNYWNSHWGCSDLLWSMLQYKQSFVINRHPHSKHLEFMQKYGLEVVYDRQIRDQSGIPRAKLAPRFRSLEVDDLTTRAAFIIARKAE